MVTTDLYGLSGQVLDGQFRIDRVIGEGGFSVVYRAQHLGLDEPVAVKCLKLQAQLGSAVVEAFIRRFRDESKIHYRLSRGSLHIVRTIAAGTTMAPATGALVPYMVLEWLEGFTLAEELRARRQRGEGGRSIEQVVHLLEPVADAMGYAHAQGVVHRDLTPSNIFFAHGHDGTSKLKVLDFGVAKVISDHALALGPRAATIGQARLFTPAYAAPEQFDEALGPIGAHTDVYSFALIITELLADRTPIEGEHFGEFADRALDRAVRPTPRTMGVSVGDPVEAVIARALAVDPSTRPANVGELWTLLRQAVLRDTRGGRYAVSYPPSPQDVAPSAREGYVPKTTLGSLQRSAPPPVVPFGDARPGHEAWPAREDVDMASDAPPARETPSAEPDGARPPQQRDAALRAAMGQRRATLFQGTMEGGLPGAGSAVASDGFAAAGARSSGHGPPMATTTSDGASDVSARTGARMIEAGHVVPGAMFSGPSMKVPEPQRGYGGDPPTLTSPGPDHPFPRSADANSAPPLASQRVGDALGSSASKAAAGNPSSLNFWIGLALALTVALVVVALIASQLNR